jgi:hypothetical protein
MSIRVLLIGTTVVASLFGAACDEKLSDLTGPTPSLEPTFASISRDIFQTSDSSNRRHVRIATRRRAVARRPRG